jgi:hypothetical protein
MHSVFHTSLSGSHMLAVVDRGFPFWQRTAGEYRFFFDLRFVLPRNNTLRSFRNQHEVRHSYLLSNHS